MVTLEEQKRGPPPIFFPAVETLGFAFAEADEASAPTQACVSG